MAYKPGAPENKGVFQQTESTLPGALSLLKNTGYGGYSGYGQSFDDVIDNTVVAVLFDWPMAGPFWLALRDDFISGDGLPVFFASELPHLRQMTPDELRRRYAEKRVLGGGWIRNHRVEH
jgi:hypothetical protein